VPARRLLFPGDSYAVLTCMHRFSSESNSVLGQCFSEVYKVETENNNNIRLHCMYKKI
jgi:hypothetical protein